MATKNKEPVSGPVGVGQTEGAGTPTELLDVEKLRSKNKIGWAVFAGVCAAQGWKPGRMVSEVDFLHAVEQFTRGPMKNEVKK